MNKEDFKLSIRRIFTDRPFLSLIAGVAIVGFVYMVITGLTIQMSDVTVYSRYTAFGEAHFYKSHWQYLLSFVFFGIMVTTFHIALMIKLHNLDRRQTAILIGWAGIAILTISAGYALSVMRLGHSV